MHRQLGLDQPLLVQFGTWLWGVLRVDFGTSLWTGRPVLEEQLVRLPLSLELVTRAALLEAMRQDYVRTARAKGLAEWRVLLKHGLKNASIPVITIMDLRLGFIVGGAIVTETGPRRRTPRRVPPSWEPC